MATANNDVLGTDIKLTGDWDLSVKDGSLELVSGTDCLKQGLSCAMQCPLFFWGMDIDFGSRLAEFVEGGEDPFYVADLRRAVNEVFEKESRVQKDSQQVDIYKSGLGIEIESEFLPIDQATSESIKHVINGRSN